LLDFCSFWQKCLTESWQLKDGVYFPTSVSVTVREVRGVGLEEGKRRLWWEGFVEKKSLITFLHALQN